MTEIIKKKTKERQRLDEEKNNVKKYKEEKQ